LDRHCGISRLATNRRMFLFTIRDVLWLMVVVGLAAALALQQQRAIQSQQESELWRSRAESASAALNAAQRQNAWHGGNVVTIEQVEGVMPGTSVPIQRVYRSKQ
jgi:hypothetical protein